MSAKEDASLRVVPSLTLQDDRRGRKDDRTRALGGDAVGEALGQPSAVCHALGAVTPFVILNEGCRNLAQPAHEIGWSPTSDSYPLGRD
jgi:hypothetical protein